MSEQDWIEQDEFERRRAMFAGKAKDKPSRGSGYRESSVQATAPLGRSIQVIVKNVGGEAVFGPEHVDEHMVVSELVKRVRQAAGGKCFGKTSIINDIVHMKNSEALGSYCDSTCSAMVLTVVQSHPLPSSAKMVGDLALWPVAHHAEQDHRQRMRKMLGVNCATGELFVYDSSVGRCTSVVLRLGNQGLYYNSSSHGTATLSYKIYEHAEWIPSGASDDEEDNDSSEDGAGDAYAGIAQELAIIPGPHCHGPKEAFALSAALQFAEKLAEATGCTLPKSKVALVQVKAWEELCARIEVSGSWFSCMYMPWIDKLGSMNEYEAFQWQQSSHPNTIAEIQDEKARDMLERGCTPEGAY